MRNVHKPFRTGETPTIRSTSAYFQRHFILKVHSVVERTRTPLREKPLWLLKQNPSPAESGGGSFSLPRRAELVPLDDQFSVLHVDANGLAPLDRDAKQRFGNPVLDVLLDHPEQGTGSVGGIVPFFGLMFLGF